MSPRRHRRSPKNKKLKAKAHRNGEAISLGSRLDISDHSTRIDSSLQPPLVRHGRQTDLEGVIELEYEPGPGLLPHEEDGLDDMTDRENENARTCFDEADGPTYEYRNYPLGFPYMPDNSIGTIYEIDIAIKPSEHLADIYRDLRADELHNKKLDCESFDQEQHLKFSNAGVFNTSRQGENETIVSKPPRNSSLSIPDSIDNFSTSTYWTDNLPLRPFELSSPSSISTLTNGLRDMNPDYLLGLQSDGPSQQTNSDDTNSMTIFDDFNNDSAVSSTDDTIFIPFQTGQSTPTTLDIAVSSSSSEAGSLEGNTPASSEYFTMGNQSSKKSQGGAYTVDITAMPDTHSAGFVPEYSALVERSSRIESDFGGPDTPHLISLADMKDDPTPVKTNTAGSPTPSSISAFELVPKSSQNEKPLRMLKVEPVNERDIFRRYEALGDSPFSKELSMLGFRAQSIIGAHKEILPHITARCINAYHAKARSVEDDLNKLILEIHEARVKHLEGCKQKEKLRIQQGWGYRFAA